MFFTMMSLPMHWMNVKWHDFRVYAFKSGKCSGDDDAHLLPLPQVFLRLFYFTIL